MKLPVSKNDSFGSHDAVLMSLLALHVTPSSCDVAWNVSISTSFGSLRLSSQIACSVPFGSAAIDGKNWSSGAGSPVPVTESVFTSLQCFPPSRDRTYEMSAPDVAASALFWNTYSSEPVFGFAAREEEIAIAAFFAESWSSGFGLSTNCPGLSMRNRGEKVLPPLRDRLK